MTSDLVSDLESFAEIIDKAQGIADVRMLSGSLLLDAANKIKELVEAGESMYDIIRDTDCQCPGKCKCGLSAAMIEWKRASCE